MRSSVWVAAIAALVVWSLLGWGGHALLDWSSDWAAANADKISPVPEVVEWVSWSFRSLGYASEIVVLIVWAIGSILIIGLAGLISRFLAGRRGKLTDLKNWRG
ncbi:MAG: hypothetical protein DCF30_19205 [Hyphomicrobiales bacterium]|nr:MAG: hypothetical protein DCF30_19205 [Hyphomicrobiales bacterium]